MRLVFFFIIGPLFFASCKKQKEIREWKKKEGVYSTEVPYILYQDSLIALDAKEIQINASGFTCHGNGGAGTTFSVFHKDENPNKQYEYKCQYSSVSNYVFGGESVSNTQIPFEKFTQGREFYLTFSGNGLTFSIIQPDGTIDDITYNKN